MRLTEVTDVIMEMHGNVQVLLSQVKAIEQHAREVNGSVAELKKETLRAEGALAAMRWMITTTLGLVGVGATVAGVVLAIVASK